MNNPSTALVLLTTQRHHLESRPDERAVARLWRMRVEAARAVGQVIVHVQWDGAPGTLGETFSRGWVHHPDFRVEERDLRVRARGKTPLRAATSTPTCAAPGCGTSNSSRCRERRCWTPPPSRRASWATG